jgi:polyphosphate glucokinase
MESSVKKVLVVDVGGTNVKVLATRQDARREFPSGPTMTAKRMVSQAKKISRDWKYDVVSIGYPGPVLQNRPLAKPHNLGRGGGSELISKPHSGVPRKSSTMRPCRP